MKALALLLLLSSGFFLASGAPHTALCKNPVCQHSKSVHANGGGMCLYFDGCDHFQAR